MKAIRVYACGDPEEMKLEELPTPETPLGHVLVQVKAAGVNFFDTQLRSGLYKRGLPVAMGVEGAGIVDTVAADVKDVKPGDRVCWVCSAFLSSLSTRTCTPGSRPSWNDAHGGGLG